MNSFEGEKGVFSLAAANTEAAAEPFPATVASEEWSQVHGGTFLRLSRRPRLVSKGSAPEV